MAKVEKIEGEQAWPHTVLFVQTRDVQTDQNLKYNLCFLLNNF